MKQKQETQTAAPHTKSSLSQELSMLPYSLCPDHQATNSWLSLYSAQQTPLVINNAPIDTIHLYINWFVGRILATWI